MTTTVTYATKGWYPYSGLGVLSAGINTNFLSVPYVPQDKSSSIQWGRRPPKRISNINLTDEELAISISILMLDK